MATPPTWSLVLTNLQGAVLGEIIGATEVQVAIPLNRIPTMQFRVPLWHSLAPALLESDTMIKAYRRDPGGGTNRLVFVGLVQNGSESGTELQQTIQMTAVGPYFRLTKRLIGTTKGGATFNSGVTGSPPTPIARSVGQIAHDVLVTANGRGYTGIEAFGSVTGTPGQLINSGPVSGDPPVGMAQGSVGPWWLKNAAEAIAELAASLNAFDFMVYPVEPANVGKAFPQIGYLHVEDLIGDAKPNAIFEYGTPRANVKEYTRDLTRDGYLNRAVVPVSGWPDGTTKDLVVREDTTYITNVGLYEEAVNDAGVEDDTLRANIGDEHLLYRKTPREIVTFTVVSNAKPTPYVDFNVGDYVRGRAQVRGILRFDSMFRIWGMTFSLDQNGNESLDLQLVQE
jgi:hypothetical protein